MGRKIVMASSPYKTVLLKLSGESFSPANGNPSLPIDPARVDQFGAEIAKAQKLHQTNIAIVVGGGNIWRGGGGPAAGMDRADADHMGMLATVINALALKDALIRHGANDPRVMSALSIHAACEDWLVHRARKHLSKGRIVICAAGLGEPHFTTDTAAVQRARDIHADIVLKGTHNVDGVYSADPHTDATAQKYDQVSFDEVIAKNLRVMDPTAFTHAHEDKLPIRVFNSVVPGNIEQALAGVDIGTLVHA